VFVFFPIGVDVPLDRYPWMNWLIILGTIVAYPYGIAAIGLESDDRMYWVAGGGSAMGYLTSLFIHAGIVHLLGNMLFLWVFGNAVCAKVGNFLYLLLYVAIGVGGGVLSQMLRPAPSVGASGAINGIVGMYVVWYALNDVRMFYAYWFFGRADAGDTEVAGFWVVGMYLAWDLWGALFERGGRVAHQAHLAGLVCGVAIAIALLKLRWTVMNEDERSLLDLWNEWRRGSAGSQPSAKRAARAAAESPTAARESLTKRDTAARAEASNPMHPRRPHYSVDDAPIPLDDSPIPLDDEPSIRPDAPPTARSDRAPGRTPRPPGLHR